MMRTGQPIVVIGGGFYGCSIAEYLGRQGAEVLLLEQASDLLTRASYHNQARLHGGYHYPRSFSTAYRSRLNFERFLQDFRPAIVDQFTKLYAIARVGSKVSPHQFEFFCRTIEAPLRPASSRLQKLFSPRLISAVYETQEYGFDAAVLRQLLVERLLQVGVKVQLNTIVAAVQTRVDGQLNVLDGQGNSHLASTVFNCTYAGLNTIAGISSTRLQLKHEITELALVQLPPELENISVTVMDGPFFSFMPFPDRQLFTFTHVRYTPHSAWLEADQAAPENAYAALASYPARSTFRYMIRDAQRYMPCLEHTSYQDSLFEIKTVLIKNEMDDGRPILFEVDPQLPGVISVLGSKIDNIYDALAAVKLYFDGRL